MTTTAKDLYSKLEAEREPYLKRARAAAALTIPSLIPPANHTAGEDLRDPYQSVGAAGVNSLASKLLQTLLNSPFFRLRPLPQVALELAEDSDLEEDVLRGLAMIEELFMSDVVRKGDGVAVFEAMKHLAVGGNALFMDDPDEGLKLFRLDKYITQRDAFGTPVRIIVREVFTRSTADQRVLDLVPETNPSDTNPTRLPSSPMEEIEVYTVVQLRDGRYYIWQEVADGQVVPGSTSDVPSDRLNWHALRMVRIDGENYGRGIVDEYYGDLNSLEILTKAIVEGSAASSKVLFLVRPNGNTKMSTLAEAPNGAIRSGEAEDVTVVRVDKATDFATAERVARGIEERLMATFLMNQSVRRDAERVTAEEIRFVAEELERGLGGIYSILTQEFQLPYVQVRLAQLQRNGTIPRFPEGVVDPVIITGLDALERGRDAERIVRFFNEAISIVGPQAVLEVINVRSLMERLALADGVDTSDLLLSEQDVQQAAQQQQQQQLTMAVAPNAVDAGASLLQSGIPPQVQEALAGATGIQPPQG